MVTLGMAVFASVAHPGGVFDSCFGGFEALADVGLVLSTDYSGKPVGIFVAPHIPVAWATQKFYVAILLTQP